MTGSARIPALEPRDSDTELSRAIDRFTRRVMAERTLDPMIIELVRLRCAQYHDCRMCGSVRFDEALQEGLDEEIVASIARYETSALPDRAKAAIRLADHVIVEPGAVLTPEARTALRDHFTPAEIAELLLQIVKWSQQKVLVSLRIDEPAWDGIATLSLGADGSQTVGGVTVRPG